MSNNNNNNNRPVFFVSVFIVAMVLFLAVLPKADVLVHAQKTGTIKNATTATSAKVAAGSMTNPTPTTSANTYLILGNPFYVAHGKITIQKPVKSNTTASSSNSTGQIDATYTASGTAKGVNVTDTGSFSLVSRANGIQYGQGQGALITKGGDSTAPFNFQFIGNTDNNKGKSIYHGNLYVSNPATGKLSSLNNAALLFKAEVEKNGAFSIQGWEWNK